MLFDHTLASFLIYVRNKRNKSEIYSVKKYFLGEIIAPYEFNGILNLSYRDLRNRKFEGNISNSNLSGCNFERVVCWNSTFDKAYMKDIKIKNGDFFESTFYKTDFLDVHASKLHIAISHPPIWWKIHT